MFNFKHRSRCLGLMLLAAIGSGSLTQGQAINGYPLTANNFVQMAQHGFGDINNNWPQAMIWWKNNLYVGASRNSQCTSLYGVHLAGIALLGQALADQFLPYPPADSSLPCTPDPADLPLQAEIWRWAPTNTWTRVFQSPNVLPNPGSGPPGPPRTGKFLPYEMSIRGFAAHKESDGTEALYAFGVNTTIIWDRNQLPPPRILRTIDGINWAPLPQDPGTFLHSLPFNPDHSSFRSPVSFNGKLFVLSGPAFGQGTLIASTNPSQGNNAWFVAADPSILFFEMASFNGWLYLGGIDLLNGYAVYKTKAEGPPPYALTQVVPAGAGLTVRPSRSVVSMFVHYNRLYVGTATYPEIIRINADDTWDLVMGAPRIDPWTNLPKFPLSNLDAGFGMTLNDHVWYQSDANNYLYAGTYNASTGARRDPVNGPLLEPTMGGHLYVTPDDWYYSAVTTNGFANLNDPLGGKFNFGVRTMASTPYGLFVGMTNDHYGFDILRGNKGVSPPVQAPSRMDIETSRSGGALLSWKAGLNATSYQIWRAEILPIFVRDDVNFENWNGYSGNKVPDVYVGPYQMINTTTSLSYIDSSVQSGKRYMYYIVGSGQRGQSPPSNLGTFPNLLPSITFSTLLNQTAIFAARGRFTTPDPTGATALQTIFTAKTAAAFCQIGAAITTLTPQATSRAVLVPDQVDYQILIAKVIRRLQLFQQYPTEVVSTEFCAGP